MTDPMYRIAEFMEVSARTAPKAAGQDYISTKIIDEEDLERLADEMNEYGDRSGKINFDRDGESVRNSEAVLLVSLEDADVLGLDCGACGYSTCEDLKEKTEGPEFDGPNCSWRLIDLGVALGSAVKTASFFNADNRIMYRIGVVAKLNGWIDGDLVVGVPVSASGKNVFFDR